MKTQEIYNNVLETRDFQHVSQYARRRQDGDLSHTQITAVIFAPKIAPKGIKLPPKRAAKWSIVRYPTKYKNLVTVEITRFFAFLLGAPAGISPAGDKLRLPGSDQKKSPRQKARRFFWCSSGDSNPNRIARFQCLLLSDNTFDNFLLRFTYRLTLLCTSCLRLSSRSV